MAAQLSMEVGCGGSTKFLFLFQVFLWPMEAFAVLRQKHAPTLVKLSRDGTQLRVWGLLLLQNPLLKVKERDCGCSRASNMIKK